MAITPIFGRHYIMEGTPSFHHPYERVRAQERTENEDFVGLLRNEDGQRIQDAHQPFFDLSAITRSAVTNIDLRSIPVTMTPPTIVSGTISADQLRTGELSTRIEPAPRITLPEEGMAVELMRVIREQLAHLNLSQYGVREMQTHETSEGTIDVTISLERRDHQRLHHE